VSLYLKGARMYRPVDLQNKTKKGNVLSVKKQKRKPNARNSSA
jgi:hypothetical protein